MKYSDATNYVSDETEYDEIYTPANEYVHYQQPNYYDTEYLAESIYDLPPYALPAFAQAMVPRDYEPDFDKMCQYLAQERNDEIWDQLSDALNRKLASTTTSNGNLRELQGQTYKLEKLDTQHRVGFLLQACLNKYKTIQPTTEFFEWLDQMGEYERMTLLRQGDSLKPSFVKMFVKGVAYMDDATRKKYNITFQGGRGYKEGMVFDTAQMSTHFSGRGWAVFVLSERDRFYSSNHVVGRMHHSSFMSGQAVKGAGEWKIIDGQIKIITAKSGHYKPTLQNFLTTLEMLQRLGVNLNSVEVGVKQFGSSVQVNASSFLADKGQGYTIW